MAKQKKTIKTREEKIAKAIKPPESNFRGVDRIMAMPDLTAKLPSDFIRKTLLQYSMMEDKQILKASKDPHLTMFERMVIQQIFDASKSGKLADKARAMYQDRVSGKSIAKLEHSGPEGTPIKLEQSVVDAEFDKKLNSLSDSEFNKYEKAVSYIKRISTRE